MSPEWGTLPLLPLRCVLEHLSVEDAMAAMSTCRHWRSAILLYEGRKEILRLRTKQLEKSLYVARVFRKRLRKLHVYLDGSDQDLDDFMQYVLTLFFDTAKLREIVFIGPSYILQNHHVPVIKLKRIITESLIYKHLHSLERFALMGCELGVAKGEAENLTPKQLDYYARRLYFSHALSPDTTLSQCNMGDMAFSALKHLIADYEHVSSSGLVTLCEQAQLAQLTLNIRHVTSQRPPKRLRWPDHCTLRVAVNIHLVADYEHVSSSGLVTLCEQAQLAQLTLNIRHVTSQRPPKRLRWPDHCTLRVAVNIISVPSSKFDEIIENVLGEGMNLVSLKVLFCKALYPPLVEHIVRVHKESLQELVWADAPQADPRPRLARPRSARPQQYGINNVNPFILLCWQCTQLRRLVIHGYWIWQYDLVGFVRLRKSLAQLQVSAVRAQDAPDLAPRVRATDAPHTLQPQFLQEMNMYASGLWSPVPWSGLEPGLRARSSPQQQAAYVLQEVLRPLGVT